MFVHLDPHIGVPEFDQFDQPQVLYEEKGGKLTKMWIKCGPKKHGEVSEDGVKNQQTLPRMNQHDFLNMFYLLMMNHWMEMMETLCFFLATSCCNVDIS